MRILLITYNFLQYYNASSIQARRFFGELANRGYKITVITNRDRTNINFYHENISVYQLFSFKKKLFNKVASLLRFHELNFMPDWDLLLWNPFLYYGKTKEILNGLRNFMIHGLITVI